MIHCLADPLCFFWTLEFPGIFYSSLVYGLWNRLALCNRISEISVVCTDDFNTLFETAFEYDLRSRDN